MKNLVHHNSIFMYVFFNSNFLFYPYSFFGYHSVWKLLKTLSITVQIVKPGLEHTDAWVKASNKNLLILN